MLRRRTLAGLLPAGIATAFARPALAQASDYPNRPVRIVVGFAAGGATDITTRTMVPRLQQALGGATLLVENRPGAGGNVATELVTRAPPDGHVLLMGTIGALAINPTLYRNLGFDPQADLTPIGMAGNILNVLVVPAERPWRNVAELVAAARARPGAVTYGSSGIGGAGHLGGALLDQMAGIQTVHVPYRGGGPMMNELIAGRVDYAFATAPTAVPHIESGRLRAIGVPTKARTRLLPDVPAVAETLPGYEVANWYALLGPRGLPRPIVDRLNAAVRETLQDAEVLHHLVRHGVEATPSTPEELGQFIRSETAKWAPIVRATGATPD